MGGCISTSTETPKSSSSSPPPHSKSPPEEPEIIIKELQVPAAQDPNQKASVSSKELFPYMGCEVPTMENGEIRYPIMPDTGRFDNCMEEELQNGGAEWKSAPPTNHVSADSSYVSLECFIFL